MLQSLMSCNFPSRRVLILPQAQRERESVREIDGSRYPAVDGLRVLTIPAIMNSVITSGAISPSNLVPCNPMGSRLGERIL